MDVLCFVSEIFLKAVVPGAVLLMKLDFPTDLCLEVDCGRQMKFVCLLSLQLKDL